jgi:hypothetical protein
MRVFFLESGKTEFPFQDTGYLFYKTFVSFAKPLVAFVFKYKTLKKPLEILKYSSEYKLIDMLFDFINHM